MEVGCSNKLKETGGMGGFQESHLFCRRHEVDLKVSPPNKGPQEGGKEEACPRSEIFAEF